MATSGTTTWQTTRDSAISSALRKLAVLPSGGTASATQISDASDALNAMIKGFHADGMPLWAINQYTFNTVANTGSYNIGTGQTLNTPMPLKVIQGYRVEQPGAVNIPLLVYNHYDYNLLPVNATSGEPVNLFYQPFSTYGVLKLWPTPIDATTTITIVYQRPFEDMNTSTDNFDFPPYWSEAIIYGLAWRLAPEYGIPIQDRQVIQKEAEYFHQMAMSFGTEEGSISFMPDWTGRSR
jgi:hypothetical protein